MLDPEYQSLDGPTAERLADALAAALPLIEAARAYAAIADEWDRTDINAPGFADVDRRCDGAIRSLRAAALALFPKETT